MVPPARIELALQWNAILNRTRLPVPPWRHLGKGAKLYKNNIKKISMIKMDVEGAELKALQGAAGTIRAWHPLLAISLYHKPEDLLTIPQYIQSLSADYHFYLRGHHPELAFELVLYAVPKSRLLQ